MSGTALEQVMASVEASNLRRREAVEASYKRLCSGAGLPQVGPEESLAAGRFAVCLNIVTGRQPEEIERCGRLADAIVMAHPSLTDTHDSGSMATAFVGPRRPVPLAPPPAATGSRA